MQWKRWQGSTMCFSALFEVFTPMLLSLSPPWHFPFAEEKREWRVMQSSVSQLSFCVTSLMSEVALVVIWLCHTAYTHVCWSFVQEPAWCQFYTCHMSQCRTAEWAPTEQAWPVVHFFSYNQCIVCLGKDHTALSDWRTANFPAIHRWVKRGNLKKKNRSRKKKLKSP